MTQIFAEPQIISREQAIRDGALIDLMQPDYSLLVRKAVFPFPVAMTATAFAATVGPLGEPLGPAEESRLSEILDKVSVANFKTKDRTVLVEAPAVNSSGEIVRIQGVLGLDDAGKPAWTLMLENED